MANQSSTADDTRQFVRFTVGDEDFGVDILSVQEIIRPVEVTSLPHAPDFVEGMINLRGSLVPIIDLCARLGFPPRDRGEETRILVVELEERTVGLVTGPVSEVLQAQEETIEPAPDLAAEIDENAPQESAVQKNAAQGNAVQGVAKLEGQLLLLLSPERLFSEEETKALQSVEGKEKVAAG
jgi:purine-binding chemotaxis protein CheW